MSHLYRTHPVLLFRLYFTVAKVVAAAFFCFLGGSHSYYRSYNVPGHFTLVLYRVDLTASL